MLGGKQVLYHVPVNQSEFFKSVSAFNQIKGQLMSPLLINQDQFACSQRCIFVIWRYNCKQKNARSNFLNQFLGESFDLSRHFVLYPSSLKKCRISFETHRLVDELRSFLKKTSKKMLLKIYKMYEVKIHTLLYELSKSANRQYYMTHVVQRHICKSCALNRLFYPVRR